LIGAVVGSLPLLIAGKKRKIRGYIFFNFINKNTKGIVMSQQAQNKEQKNKVNKPLQNPLPADKQPKNKSCGSGDTSKSQAEQGGCCSHKEPAKSV
jgi:hypothetical protein